jgi:hypothetical protein
VQSVIAQSIAFAYKHEGPALLGEDAPLDLDAPGGWASVTRAISRLEDLVMGGRQFRGVVCATAASTDPAPPSAATEWSASSVRRRRLPVVGDGAGQTPMIHLDDVIGATLAALDYGWGLFNIADDVPAPAREWIPALAAALGAPVPRRVPAWVARAATGVHTVRVMTTQRGASNARAKAELGWNRSIRTGAADSPPSHRTGARGARGLTRIAPEVDGGRDARPPSRLEELRAPAATSAAAR